MAKESIIIALRGKGLTFEEIARRLKIRESFVRSYFGADKKITPAKPHGLKHVYRREALETVLREKERRVQALANDIVKLREQISQLSALEVSRAKLSQAIKDI